MAASGFWATDLSPCDKNIFRSHNFPVVLEDTCCSCKPSCFGEDSDQPSFVSANFPPFTSAESVLASDISTVLSPNLHPNTYGGTVEKITSSPYKICGATQKKENQTGHYIQNQ